ncbi:MAG TPA: 50S ribosomal protein L5 [Candidatus Woesearchaeota archaeon]|nr:50S ribosomal protein L5 [Candidatus Woesearchaeota archaeon]
MGSSKPSPKAKAENPYRAVRLEKITLNLGAGRDAARLDAGLVLLERITGMKPVKTFTSKRIPTWDIRPGLPLGVKVTVRGRRAEELLKRLLSSVNSSLKESSFDEAGNFSFGIPEYIDIPDLKYDPKLGIFGFEVAVTLKRAGFRVRRRKSLKKKIGTRIDISKEDAMEFAKKELGAKII